MVNKYIFREYDIRGKVVDDFPPAIVVQLGKGFGTFVKRNGFHEIALSGDIRLTTPDLMDQFKKGVLSTGVDVINLGILPTPANYYSMFKLEVGGAVQITGSHNPPEFNGFKMSLDRKAVYGKNIQVLREYIDNNDFDIGEGNEIKYDIKSDYKSMIIEKINIERPMKVVMDCGNAAGAINAPNIFNSLNVELTEIFCEPDGTFPNHHPDPTVKENLKDLISIMKKGNHDIGTIDEVFEVIATNILTNSSKLLILLNYNGFWNKLIDLLNTNIKQKYSKKKIKDNIRITTSVSKIFTILDNG